MVARGYGGPERATLPGSWAGWRCRGYLIAPVPVIARVVTSQYDIGPYSVKPLLQVPYHLDDVLVGVNTDCIQTVTNRRVGANANT